MAKIYYYHTDDDSRIHRSVIREDIPDSVIRSRLIEIGKGTTKPIGVFGSIKDALLKIKPKVAPIEIYVPENVTEFFFPSGVIWNRNTNQFEYANLVRYNHLVAHYTRQEAIKS